jgi:hypothetical protein
MTRDAAFTQRVRSRVSKTGERYATALRHVDRTERAEPRPPAATLHVTNGDSAALGLRAAGLDGEVLVWRDALHEGPVPAGLTPAELRHVRAAYFEREGLGTAAEVATSFATRDQRVEIHRGGEYVLWFEADLYDQLQLLQVVHRLAELAVDPQRVTLVSIGEYPGMAHFGGLGELAPDALARLRPDGRPLGPDTVQLAVEAWRAFTAPKPTALADMARRSSAELRFLGEGVGRLMQEYPSRSDGLALTERRILLAIREGADTAGEVFRDLWRRERRPYLGDTLCFLIMRRLAVAHHPLLAVQTRPPLSFARARVELTTVGREVLAGHADHIRLNGVDRWIGGTRLTGTEPRWRYDERLETLIQV